MDEETLRKQIVDQVQSQFETKLREAKRQKVQAEEELETVSEKWRTERRRLNAEIDRLEAALTEARSGDVKGGIDPQELERLKAAAADRLKTASDEWATERTQLTAQVSRLERAVADAIERSSNPIRTMQPIREQFEARLDEANKKYLALEQDFLRNQALWDEDKKKLTNELLKLRRLAPPSKALEVKEKLERLHGRSETIEERRIRELEEKLTKAHSEIEKYHHIAIAAREDTKREYERRLEEAFRERSKTEEQAKATTKQWETERQQLQDRIAKLQQDLSQMKLRIEDETARHKRESAQSRHESDALQEASAKMEDAAREKERLLGEIQHLQRTLSETREQVSAEVVEQLRLQYDQKMKDMIQQKTQLTEELQSASALLQSERARFAAEVSKSKIATVVASPPDGMDANTIKEEVARVETLLQEIGALIDDPATELSTVIRKNVEKAELDAYLKGILFSLGQGQAS
jgi:hypothetical protein